MKKRPLNKNLPSSERVTGTPRTAVSKAPSRESINLREGAQGSGFTMQIYRRCIRRLQKAKQLQLFYNRMDDLKLERRREFFPNPHNPDMDVVLTVTGYDYYLICKFAEEFKLKDQKTFDVVN